VHVRGCPVPAEPAPSDGRLSPEALTPEQLTPRASSAQPDDAGEGDAPAAFAQFMTPILDAEVRPARLRGLRQRDLALFLDEPEANDRAPLQSPQPATDELASRWISQ
jgi:hypothetical protein